MKTITPSTKISLTKNQLTSLIDFFYYDYHLENKAVKITQEIIDESNEDVPQELLGYTLDQIGQDGDHKHDGQMVEYTFRFISPKKKKTDVSTEMCLMCGWNFCYDLEVK